LTGRCFFANTINDAIAEASQAGLVTVCMMGDPCAEEVGAVGLKRLVDGRLHVRAKRFMGSTATACHGSGHFSKRRRPVIPAAWESAVLAACGRTLANFDSAIAIDGVGGGCQLKAYLCQLVRDG